MKPSMSVERSLAQFQDSTLTYNESGITYNQASITYGGSDQVQSLGKTPSFVIQNKPNVAEVD